MFLLKVLSAPTPLKKLVLLGFQIFFEPSLGVVDPGIAAQLLWLKAEPRFACMEVSVIARCLGSTQAYVTGGCF